MAFTCGTVLSPRWGSSRLHSSPTAHAVGCVLSPQCGSARASHLLQCRTSISPRFRRSPTAHAVGCILAPLRGLARAALLAGMCLSAAAPAQQPHFRDITLQAGIHFTHNNGAFGKKYLPETMGPGCAFIDYDNDGWPDIVLVNGENGPGHPSPASTLKL